eukprot:6144927-Pleurochrysis_carterae.AAC.1
MQVRLRLRRNREFTGINGVGQACAHFSSGHHMNLRPCDVAFIIVKIGSANPVSSRCTTALAFVAPCTLRKTFRFSRKRFAS